MKVEKKLDHSVENILRGRRMKRMVETYSNEIRNQYGLKQVELDILYFIAKSEKEVTSTEICNKLFLNKGQVSKAMMNLVDGGFLVSTPDKADKRVVWFKSTKATEKIVTAFEQQQKEIGKLICEGISKEELDVFCKVSCKMLHNMDKMEKFGD